MRATHVPAALARRSDWPPARRVALAVLTTSPELLGGMTNCWVAENESFAVYELPPPREAAAAGAGAESTEGEVWCEGGEGGAAAGEALVCTPAVAERP